MSNDKVVLGQTTVMLGDVAPGEFSLYFDVLIVSPIESFSADIEIDWGQIGVVNRQGDIFAVTAPAQVTGINWASLEYWHPYGTDPAEGDRFIGRAEIVRGLASRLLRTPMEPFYITGQKRVGKTSLALAAVEFAGKQQTTFSINKIYILWGQIAHADAGATLTEFGDRVQDLILGCLPGGVNAPRYSFDGSLAALVKLAEFMAGILPNDRFIIMIDEFDEIHQELYLQGSLAETFFANLRALTTTKNIGVVLVGGENMPFIMERQGEKLNKFVRQNVSYFSRATEWTDFLRLVRHPTDGTITWSEDAISAIFNETSGNPYFTNLLCSRVVLEAIRSRDADVTSVEIAEALDAEVTSMDANSFAHLWRDGILKPIAEREPDVLRRRRVLVELARCSRRGDPLTVANIAARRTSKVLVEGEIVATLTDFAKRGVLSEFEGGFRFYLPIFERWLKQNGLAIVQPDAVSEEIAASIQAEEDQAFVRSDELVKLVKKWPTYQGRYITTDDVRVWYEQVSGFRNQRLLFKLLTALRFVSEAELREKASAAYLQIIKQLREFVRHKLTDRRADVLLTYLDGHGKSGEYITSLFAEENKIDVGQICSQEELPRRLEELFAQGHTIEAVIVVDDIAGTGNTIAKSVTRCVENAGDVLKKGKTKLIVCALYATRGAADLILRSFKKNDDVECDFRVGEFLSTKLSAFSDNSAIWANTEERERAKALVTDLGARILS